MVDFCATPDKQKVPAGQGKGLVSTSESVSSVDVPSSQMNPGVHGLSGTDNPFVSHTNPAGQCCGLNIFHFGHMLPISHSLQELLLVEFE
jgi:hypothetical protein